MAKRAWVFTVNNPQEDLVFDPAIIRYAVYQYEIGSEGTTHFQGYLELFQPKRLTQMREILPHAHLEPRMGSRDQARDYAMKEDSRLCGPWEFGSWQQGGQGARSDLLSIQSLLDSGAPMRQISDTHFADFVRYHRGFQAYQALHPESPPRDGTWKTYCFVYYGQTGIGKSRRALDEARATGGGIYYRPRGDWWDGYTGQPNVIIDDFYGWIRFDELLRILDYYPLRVPFKGGFIPFSARTVWITSNDEPSLWYRNIRDLGPLLRRIDHMEHITEPYTPDSPRQMPNVMPDLNE